MARASTTDHTKRPGRTNAPANIKTRGTDKVRLAGRSITAVPVAELALIEEFTFTDKAKLFVKFWAQGESIASAAARAGYNDGGSYAYRMQHIPAVRAMYLEEKRLFEEANVMTRQRVMEGLLEGVEMGKMTSDAHAVISGWKTIGQMCGYFEHAKKPIEVKVTDLRGMQQMTDEELMAKIAGHVATEVQRIEAEDDGDQEPPGVRGHG